MKQIEQETIDIIQAALRRIEDKLNIYKLRLILKNRKAYEQKKSVGVFKAYK